MGCVLLAENKGVALGIPRAFLPAGKLVPTGCHRCLKTRTPSRESRGTAPQVYIYLTSLVIVVPFKGFSTDASASFQSNARA